MNFINIFEKIKTKLIFCHFYILFPTYKSVVHVQHLKQIGKVTRLDIVTSLWSNETKKRIVTLSFWPFLSYVTVDHFQADCVTYVTRSVLCAKTQLSGRTERTSSTVLPKPNLGPRKVQGHGWSDSNVIQYCFLDPSKTVTSEKLLCKLKRYTKSCSVCSWQRSLGRVPISHYTWHMFHRNTEYLNRLSYKVLPHPSCSPGLLPNSYHLFKHLDKLLEGKHFHSQRNAEVCIIPKHRF